jgi:hypothetical protein
LAVVSSTGFLFELRGADAAGVAVDAFAEVVLLDVESGFDHSEMVQDLINDLGHYCERHGLDFVSLCASGIAGFIGEKKHLDGWVQPTVSIAVNNLPIHQQ